jgi:hypothetical protein
MTKAYKVTGKTYPARNVLKDAGFEFDGKSKAWHGGEAELKELQRITTATYSRANQNAVDGIEITELN